VHKGAFWIGQNAIRTNIFIIIIFIDNLFQQYLLDYFINFQQQKWLNIKYKYVDQF